MSTKLTRIIFTQSTTFWLSAILVCFFFVVGFVFANLSCHSFSCPSNLRMKKRPNASCTRVFFVWKFLIRPPWLFPREQIYLYKRWRVSLFLTNEARVKRPTLQEPNQIQPIRLMWSSAFDPIKCDWFYLELLRRCARLASRKERLKTVFGSNADFHICIFHQVFTISVQVTVTVNCTMGETLILSWKALPNKTAFLFLWSSSSVQLN